jgi:hypothetical protein
VNLTHRRWHHAELLAVAVSVVALSGAGLAMHADVAVGAEAGTATELLERIASADGTPYRAKQLVAYFGTPPSNALLDVRSSPGGRFVRAESGRDVSRMWSAADIGVLAGRYTNLQEAAPPVVRLDPADVLAKYEVTVGTTEKLLGTELVPLEFARRTDGAVVERWWVHERSGVVYRRTLYDASGMLVGMSTVIEMKWGDPGPADPVSADLDRAAKVRTIDAGDAPRHLAGGYDLTTAYELEVDGTSAEQWVYTDGLHALSVFRTRGNLKEPTGFRASDVGGERVWTGPGPGTWAWQGGGQSWFVVAEEPALNAADLIEPFPRGGPSFWSRLGSVWSRLIGGIGRLFD